MKFVVKNSFFLLMGLFILPPHTSFADEAQAENLDVTITGQIRDEIPIIKVPPPADIPFPEITSLSREGQTKQVLAEPVVHMSRDKQLDLVKVNSSQVLSPLIIEFPQAPFFRMEVPANVTPYTWNFQVVSQNNQIVHNAEGTKFTSPFMTWNGYDKQIFQLKVGVAYSPILTVKELTGKTQRYVGDAVQLDALQYQQDGLFIIEFNNDTLYARGSDNFSPDIEPLLEKAFSLFRLHVGTPFRVIIYDDPPNKALTKKRLDKWQKLIDQNLVVSPDSITLTTLPPNDRGKVTAIMVLSLQ